MAVPCADATGLLHVVCVSASLSGFWTSDSSEEQRAFGCRALVLLMYVLSAEVTQIVGSDDVLLVQVKVEERWNALKKKMATAEYAGKTPAKIKDMDMENLGKAQKEQQFLEQQLHDMKQLLQ